MHRVVECVAANFFAYFKNRLRRARRDALDRAKASITPVLREQGFTAETGLPADRPIWTRQGVTVSLRQNPGAAAIVRVTFSSLDAGL